MGNYKTWKMENNEFEIRLNNLLTKFLSVFERHRKLIDLRGKLHVVELVQYIAQRLRHFPFYVWRAFEEEIQS